MKAGSRVALALLTTLFVVVVLRNAWIHDDAYITYRTVDNFINGFGLTTVAECVENAEDATLLRAEGIGYLQGYHFGRPTIGTPIV